MTETSPTDDERVGSNLRRLRNEAFLSQAQLAALASEDGLPFHQQTIDKIERGNRPLRFVEAVNLARLLQVDLERLWEVQPAQWSSLKELRGAQHPYTTAIDELEKAAAEAERKRLTLRSVLARPGVHLNVPYAEVVSVRHLIESLPEDIAADAVEKERSAEARRLGLTEGSLEVYDIDGWEDDDGVDPEA